MLYGAPWVMPGCAGLPSLFFAALSGTMSVRNFGCGSLW
jgi:hypothetical protein